MVFIHLVAEVILCIDGEVFHTNITQSPSILCDTLHITLPHTTVKSHGERSVNCKGRSTVFHNAASPPHINLTRMPPPVTEVFSCSEVTTPHLGNPFLGGRSYDENLITSLQAVSRMIFVNKRKGTAAQINSVGRNRKLTPYRLHGELTLHIHHRPTVNTRFLQHRRIAVHTTQHDTRSLYAQWFRQQESALVEQHSSPQTGLAIQFTRRHIVYRLLNASTLVTLLPLDKDDDVSIWNRLFALLVAHITVVKREGLCKTLHNPNHCQYP